MKNLNMKKKEFLHTGQTHNVSHMVILRDDDRMKKFRHGRSCVKNKSLYVKLTNSGVEVN